MSQVVRSLSVRLCLSYLPIHLQTNLFVYVSSANSMKLCKCFTQKVDVEAARLAPQAIHLAFVPDMAHGARCELVVYAVQHVKRCCAPCVIFLHRRCTLIVTFVLRSGPSSRFDHIGSYHSIWCDAPNRGCCHVIVVCCCIQFVLCTCVSKTNA